MLRNSQRVENKTQLSSYSSSSNSTNSETKQLLDSIATLSAEVRNVLREKQELTEIIKEYPNPDFLN